MQDKIESFESSSSVSRNISTDDSLARALGRPEHCGRVRGLGLGPFPSQVFGRGNRSYGGTSSTSSVRVLQNKVDYLESVVGEYNKRFVIVMNYFMSSGQHPPDLAMFQTTPVIFIILIIS